MEHDEELIQTIRDIAGFDPVEQARKEKIADVGEWLERKIGQKTMEEGGMTDADIDALAGVIHRSLIE